MHGKCFIWKVLLLAFTKSARQISIYLIAISPDLEMTQDRSAVNGTSYLGHVWNFVQYSYFSVLVGSASCLLIGFVRYTLWVSHSKLIFGNCGNPSFRMKNYSKSYVCVFTLSKKRKIDCRKNFLTQLLVVQRCPSPRWIEFVMLYRFEYKTPSHFDDLILAWTA